MSVVADGYNVAAADVAVAVVVGAVVDGVDGGGVVGGGGGGDGGSVNQLFELKSLPRRRRQHHLM